MSLVSTYPNGFANGVDILGMSILNGYAGKVFWVNSASGSNGNAGTRQKPFATLDYAIGRCTANAGDVIMVMPNHAETITGAGGITADVAGITIIGMGTYNQRPRFLMDGATTVTFAISAADVSIHNCVFAAGHADIVACFVITAAGATISACEFVNNVVDENFLTEIKATSTVDNNADGLKIINCRAMTIDASGAEFIELNADVNGLVVNGNFVSKDAATAGKFILQATGKDLRDCHIEGNRLITGMTAGDLFIDNDTAVNSGVVCRNFIGHHDTAGAVPIDCDGVRMFENYAAFEDATQGTLQPVAGTLA